MRAWKGDYQVGAYVGGKADICLQHSACATVFHLNFSFTDL